MIAAPRKKAFISASTVVYSPKRHMAAAASPYGATLALESPSESAACVSPFVRVIRPDPARSLQVLG
jgi:hypothetical protein